MTADSKERMLELLADRALFGLNEEEHAEFEELRKEYPELVDDSFDLAAAAFQTASLEEEEMPSHIANRIVDTGEEYVRQNYTVDQYATVRSVEEEQPRTSFLQWMGWVVAGAASIALVANIWITDLGTSQEVAQGPDKEVERPLSATEKRTALLASATIVRSDWDASITKNDVSGDVVWSDEKQEGYMRLKGLPVNDKSKEQYQLWIFDENQKEATPVDGGVFDITSEGEAVVPIDASLRVKGPKAFAVTVEKPGGVMVSDRERIVALAQVS